MLFNNHRLREKLELEQDVIPGAHCVNLIANVSRNFLFLPAAARTQTFIRQWCSIISEDRRVASLVAKIIYISAPPPPPPPPAIYHFQFMLLYDSGTSASSKVFSPIYLNLAYKIRSYFCSNRKSLFFLNNDQLSRIFLLLSETEKGFQMKLKSCCFELCSFA